MIISKGSSQDKQFVLTEDTVFTDGNHLCPKITTNGFALTFDRIVPGATVDGSKDPADWGANVTVNCPWPDHLGKDFVFRTYKRDESTDGFREKLHEKEVFEAAMHPIQWIHDNPTGTAAQWKVTFLAEAVKPENDWWVSVDVLQQKLAGLANVSTWAEFVAKVLTKSVDTWRGKDTLLDVEVI